MKIERALILFVFMGLFSIPVVAQEVYQQQVLLQSSWGSGDGQFGLQSGLELETVGPLTFTLDKSGNIYIYDFINERFQEFDKSGKFLRAIGKELICSSFCVDEFGNLYLLDVYNKSVKSYSGKGAFQREFKVADAIQLIEGYGQNVFIDADKNLAVNRVDQVVHPLASLAATGLINQTPTLLSAAEQVQDKKFGYLGKSDKQRYQMQWRNKHQADIVVTAAANYFVRAITMTTPDEFGAVLFLGQDATGNIYTETERTDAKNILHLEVRKYSSDGKLLATIEVPNDYYTTVYKKLELDDAGNIYQMHITKQGVEIIKYYE